MTMKSIAFQNGVSIGDVTIENINELLKLEHTFVWVGLLEANRGYDNDSFIFWP
jgi:magnesium transporter